MRPFPPLAGTKPDDDTLGAYLRCSYANLAMAMSAINNGDAKYKRVPATRP